MGGNALQGTVRINQCNSNVTLKKIYAEFSRFLPEGTKMAALGSIDKKRYNDTSGDIDMAVEATWDEVLMAVKMSHRVYREMKSVGIIFVEFPIGNSQCNQAGQYVQLDLMVVDNIEYAKWAYHSPCYWESQWSGLYRNRVNFNIAKYCQLSYEDDNTWTRYWITHQDGLMWGRQTNISPKTGKVGKTIHLVGQKNYITKDPDKIVSFLYGTQYKANDILTFEQALNALMESSSYHGDRLPQILKGIKQSILDKGVPVPDILEQLLV